MKIKQKISEFWQSLKPKAKRHPNYKPFGREQTLEIAFAFRANGKDYYYPKDISIFGPRRIQEYELRHLEYIMGVDGDFLDYFSAEMDKQLNPDDGIIRTGKVAELHAELKARRYAVRPERTMYYLCSVYFFDLSEDLTTYDIQHNNDKIDGWIEDGGPAGFFLNKPVQQFLGLKVKSKSDLTRKIKAGEILRRSKRAVYLGK